MDKSLNFDSLAVLNTRFSALGLALDGLAEQAKYCQVDTEQIEAIELLFLDLKHEYREVLRAAE